MDTDVDGETVVKLGGGVAEIEAAITGIEAGMARNPHAAGLTEESRVTAFHPKLPLAE